MLKQKRELDILDKIRILKQQITDFENAASILYDKVKPYTGPKVVVYGGTKECYDKMEISVKTLLANSKVDKIIFLINTDEFPIPLPDIVEVINTAEQPYYFPWGFNNMYSISYMTMMRHVLYDMFPQYDRILWLDVDTLVMDDISGIFDSHLGDYYYFAAVKEDRHYLKYTSARKIEDIPEGYHDLMLEPSTYYNAAVLLENLKLLRDSGMGEQLVNRLNNYLIYYSDQTLINEMCRDRILTLDYEWNTSHATGEVRMPRIIHVSSGKRTDAMNDIINRYKDVSFDDIMEWRKKREEMGVMNGKK